jgi:hypothetical protein
VTPVVGGDVKLARLLSGHDSGWWTGKRGLGGMNG